MVRVLMVLAMMIGVSLSSFSVNANESSDSVTAPSQKQSKKQFHAQLKNEQKQFRKEERASLKAFNLEQSQELKRWFANEKKARREFFEKHLNGPERREYVQQYLKRKKEFKADLKKQAREKREGWKDRYSEFMKEQRARRLEFEKSDQNSSQVSDASSVSAPE